MSRRSLLALLLAPLLLLAGLLSAPSTTHAANCTFELGFKTLHDLIPNVTGACLENEHHNPKNGDGLQATERGLLVWRKADNWTAFTDGYRTWINGPKGLQERLNTQRFAWEKPSHVGPADAYPDSSITPGAVDPRVTQANIHQTICVSGYTATVRPPVSFTEPLKIKQIAQYGFADTNVSDYEEDHFVPLEIGGAPADPKNLFPEHYREPYGAHDKDKVENYLHRQVCDGAMTLAAAQHAIETDWVAVYQRIEPSSPPATPTAGHTYYLSTYYTAHDYYCDTDPDWHNLSAKYLVHLPTLTAVQQQYPGRTLHAPC